RNPQFFPGFFDVGIKTRIKITADGTFKLEDGNWLETTTADFDAGVDAGVKKDNINTANDELKLLSGPGDGIEQEYATGQDAWFKTEYYAIAQRFVPTVNCKATKIKIYLRRFNEPGNLTVYLKSGTETSPG
ncbi:unnamed protein product, partial [marine sediment metagenome]